MNSILIIDDEPAILDSLKVLLHGDYHVFTAENATDAQKILANEAIQVVLSDHFLPDTSGMEFLQEVQTKYPHIIRILITGYANFEMAEQAINQGHVYKFLTKPLNPAMLKVEIAEACTMYRLMQKNRDLADELQRYNSQLEQQVEERTAEIIRSRNRYQALVESMPVWVWETNENFEVTYSSPHCLAVTGYPPEELLGRLIFDFLILPQRVDAITAEVRLTLTSPEAIANITEQIAEKSGNVQYLQSSIRPILSKNSPSPSYIGVSRDVTQQKEHEETSRRHERELSLLVEASNYLTTVGEESTALDSMLRGASLAVGADSGLLFLYDQKAENFSIVSANGFAGTQLKSAMEKLSQLELGSTRGIVGLVGQTRAILTIEHVKNDPRWIKIDPKIESAIWIPISHEGRLLGVLSLFSHAIAGFNRTSIRLGKLFADKVAVVLENNRLYSEISRSAERYGSIIENALDVIYICDLNGQVLYTNPQATVLLGYTEQEFQQQPIWELIVPQYRKSVRKTYQDMLNQDFKRQFIQFEIEDKQGKRHWFEQNVSVLQRDGISNIFQAINRDLSDRKQAERALKLSEQRYRHLVENAHEMVILVNPDGLLTFFNDSFMRSTGYSHQESEQLEFQKLIHADDWSQLKNTIHKLLAGQCFSPTHEFRLLTKSGATRYIDATFSTVTEDDAVTAVQSMMRDVTERKQSEAALQEYKERLSLVFENITEVVYSTQANGKLNFISPTVKKVFGKNYEEFLEKTLWEAISPLVKSRKTLTEVRCRIRAEREDQSAQVQFELEMVLGAAIRIMEFTEFNQFDNQGNFAGSNAVIHEVTHRRKAERKTYQTMQGAIQAISLMVELRDPFTAGHHQNTAKIASAIAERMHVSDEQLACINLAASLLDVGKISIPAELLNKTAMLSEAEMSIIETHATLGADILKQIPWPWPVAEIVEQHHERKDGSGYPRGLRGTAILLEARILAVADSIDAMINHRPYRPATSVEDAILEISSMSKKFDKTVLSTMRELHQEGFFSELSNTLFFK